MKKLLKKILAPVVRELVQDEKEVSARGVEARYHKKTRYYTELEKSSSTSWVSKRS
jgi:hypothetical protein